MASVTVATVTVVSLTACGSDGGGDSDVDDFTYVLDTTPVTTNAASTTGVVTGAAALSARLYPGAFIPGPGNRLLPNTDLVTATPREDDPDTVDYVIAESATYSDGAPVVCDDFLLSWVAAHRTDLFAADPGLITRVRDIDCAAGAKDFRVDFEEDAGQRYRELFSPGEVLPAHAVAATAEVPSVVNAVDLGDEAALTALGEAWTTTFDLSATDPSTVPTYGPFRIAERREDGSLLLTANPEWAGDRPGLDRIVVRGGGDLQQILDGTADVVDAVVRPDQPSDADLTAAGVTVDRDPGSRVDGLTLSDTGVFSTAEARRAFASCIDRDAVVAAVSRAIGAPVSPTSLRVASPGNPAAETLTTAAETPTADGAVLDGATVRIAVPGGTPRHTAAVAAVTSSCATAGVTVETVPVDAATFDTPGALGGDFDAVMDTRTAFGRNPEVTASPVSTVTQIRAAEAVLAEDARTVPLTVAPRLTAVTGTVSDVSDSGTDTGLSWNMDRWTDTDHPLTETPEPTSEETSE